jgi:hypothetical protein
MGNNSAGDILFDCVPRKVHVYTSNVYEVDFLDYEVGMELVGWLYVGTLNR